MLRRASFHEVVYQAVMRTSLRNPGSSEKVHAIVPDEPSAKRLAELVGTTEVNQLGALVGPPRSSEPYTASDKAKRQKAKKAIDKLYAPKAIPRSFIYHDGMDSGALHPQELEPVTSFKDSKKSTGDARGLGATLPTPLESSNGVGDNQGHGHQKSSLRESNTFQCFVTLHKSPKAFDRQEFLQRGGSISDFVAFFKARASEPLKAKDESLLFNPCIFDPQEGATGYRRKEHFKQSSFLVLDFDDGSLSPEDFIKIFWTEAKRGTKRSFVICNTFSRTPQTPNKFRVIMFYKQPATTLEQHRAVYDLVLARLGESGYSASDAKLDHACRSGVQSFYLPCTNKKHPEQAIFRTFGVKSRDLERCAIDPVEVAKDASARTMPVSRISADMIRSSLREATCRDNRTATRPDRR